MLISLLSQRLANLTLKSSQSLMWHLRPFATVLPGVAVTLATPTPGPVVSELLMNIRLTFQDHFKIQRNGAQLEGHQISFLRKDWA